MSTNVVIFLSAYYVVNCSETIHCSNNIRAQKIRLTCSSAVCKYHFFLLNVLCFMQMWHREIIAGYAMFMALLVSKKIMHENSLKGK